MKKSTAFDDSYLMQQVEDLVFENSNLELKLEEQTARVHTLEEHIARLKQKQTNAHELDEIKESHSRKVAEMEQEIFRLIQRNKELKKENQHLEEKLASADTSSDKARALKAEEDLVAAQKFCASLQEQLTSANAEMDRLKQELENPGRNRETSVEDSHLRRTCDELEEQLKESAKTIEQHQSDQEYLRNQVDRYVSEIDSLKKTVETMRHNATTKAAPKNGPKGVAKSGPKSGAVSPRKFEVQQDSPAEETRSRLTNLERQLSTLQSRNKKYKEDLFELRKEKREALQRLAELER